VYTRVVQVAVMFTEVQNIAAFRAELGTCSTPSPFHLRRGTGPVFERFCNFILNSGKQESTRWIFKAGVHRFSKNVDAISELYAAEA
jgi:hypothetical protein